MENNEQVQQVVDAITNKALGVRLYVTGTTFVAIDMIINDKGVHNAIEACRKDPELLQHVIHMAHTFKTAPCNTKTSPYDVQLAICAVVIRLADKTRYAEVCDPLFSEDLEKFPFTKEVYNALAA